MATHRLPILRYRSIGPGAGGAPERDRVAADAFEAQLRYLADAGFRGVTLEEWRQTKTRWEPLPGRAVMLTFDDGYRDFADHAWPLLRRYGFPALVFLATGYVGATSAWGAAHGGELPLLAWDEVKRLRDEGVEFGSHTASRPRLTSLSPADVAQELAESRAALSAALGTGPTALAYPHGSEDPVVQHLVGACGYTYGLTTRPAPSDLTDSLLSLPRLEVRGDQALPELIGRLAP